MKKVFLITGLLGFALMLGAAGGSDQGAFTFTRTFWQALCGLAIVFGSAAGAYLLDCQGKKEDKK